MRTSHRDRRTIWYALYKSESEDTNLSGEYTGEHSITYETPVKAKMNVSGGKGRAEVELFGIDAPFTRVAVTEDLTTPFNTDTVFWFGIEPTGPNNAHIPHNYRCTGISRTVNQVVIALAEVEKS